MEFVRAVKHANIEIYNLLLKTPHDILCKKYKTGEGGDISIFADLEAEKIFIKYLLPFGSIYSEESGMIKNGKNKIILDPIDGSNNLKSKIPFYGTSVALEKSNKITHAIVTNLINGDIFIKTDHIFEIHSIFNDTKRKIDCNTYSNVGIFERSYSSSLIHKELKKLSIKYRSLGSISLSLALASNIKFVLLEGVMREFDIAAGWKMCENLHRFKNSSFLLVSKDKNIFDKISKLIEKQGN